MYNLYSIDQRVSEKKRALDHINRHAWKSASIPKKRIKFPPSFWKKQSAPVCCTPCCSAN